MKDEGDILKSKNIFIILIIVLFIIICCICLLSTIAGAVILTNSYISNNIENLDPGFINPYSPENNQDYFSDEPDLDHFPEAGFLPTLEPETILEINETLEVLKNTEIPENDPYDLARRLKNIENIPSTVPNLTEYHVGDSKEFWITNVDTNENNLIAANLGYKTENVYFWVEEGVSFDKKELSRLVTTFEDDILPTNREFFGTEWLPGIDENNRLFILFAENIGSGIAGYFSSADAVPPQVHEFSNSHEMFMLSADNVRLSQKFTYGVLAHEYQHMIHWFQDRNESSWLNEGFSELAAFLNGYYDSGFDYLYLADPDIQLNDWPNSPANTTPHYGSSFLFVNYFLNRFGDEATQALVRNDKNGLESIDEVLASFKKMDETSGQIVTADDLFRDWIITNYVLDGRIEDGRYDYQNYSDVQQISLTEEIDDCQFDWKERTVKQYGADYIEFSCNQDFTIQFDGETTTKIIPESAYSGKFAFWSNKSDESNMILSQVFDFTSIDEPVEMSFMSWFDIEVDYDYLYITASTDGENWVIIDTPSCTLLNPSGNSYGCGYNGISNGWKKEAVDLSQFAGKKVEIRFEYVTDAAVNGEGFLVDDIEIPAINYFSDFESDNGGWEADGWVRIQNILPQTYKVILLEYKSGDVYITELNLSETQDAEIKINGKTNNKTLLIVAGTTRFTRQPAYYRFQSIE